MPAFFLASDSGNLNCTISTKGCPTNSTLAPASLYTSYSNGKIEATLLTSFPTALALPLRQTQAEGAIYATIGIPISLAMAAMRILKSG